MPQSVFIKVVGFTDVERHALNTLFRLSETRPTTYLLWAHDAPQPPQMALLDDQSYEARVEAELSQGASMRLIWIGGDPPDGVWRTFERPLSWPDVVRAMDEVFLPAQATELDMHLHGEGDTGPDTQPAEEAEATRGPRALIASALLEDRLYLRAKLALHGLTVADEAASAAQVQELLRDTRYEVALVDFELPGAQGWDFLKKLAGERPAIRHLVLTKAGASMGDRLRAWMAGVEGFLDKPPHPAKLEALLQKV